MPQNEPVDGPIVELEYAAGGQAARTAHSGGDDRLVRGLRWIVTAIVLLPSLAGLVIVLLALVAGRPGAFQRAANFLRQLG